MKRERDTGQLVGVWISEDQDYQGEAYHLILSLYENKCFNLAANQVVQGGILDQAGKYVHSNGNLTLYCENGTSLLRSRISKIGDGVMVLESVDWGERANMKFRRK